MRILGHPVHVMVIHFPIALWPAHWMLQLFAEVLPEPGTIVAGFWLLVAATTLGWLAALAGVMDLIELFRGEDKRAQRAGLFHAIINGTTLVAFTGLALLDYARYPHLRHGTLLLTIEALALFAMFVGNYYGGKMVWESAGPATPSRHDSTAMG